MKKLFSKDTNITQRIVKFALPHCYYDYDDSGLCIQDAYRFEPFDFVSLNSSNFYDAKDFIEDYAYYNSDRMEFTYTYRDCLNAINQINLNDSVENIQYFKSTILHCPRKLLSKFFLDHIANKFFNWDPEGRIIIINSDLVYLQRAAFLRMLYTRENFGASFDPDLGFKTLRHWNSNEPQDILRIIIYIILYLFTPFVSGFYTSNGSILHFVFLHNPKNLDIGNSSINWNDFCLRSIDFALDKVDNLEVGKYKIKDTVLYGKYVFTEPPSITENEMIIKWSIESSNKLVKRLFNLSNFLTENNNNLIDPIYNFEYNQTIMHILRDVAFIQCSPSSYQNKARLFRIADLFSSLAQHGSLHLNAANFFKRLFKFNDGKALVNNILASSGISPLNKVSQMTDELYDSLKNKIYDSVWLPSKKTATHIKVKNSSLTGDTSESIEDFISNVMRVYRNTHHGYLNRGDNSRNRPVRYLSLLDGDTPSELPSLSISWLIAYLVSAENFVGNPS